EILLSVTKFLVSFTLLLFLYQEDLKTILPFRKLIITNPFTQRLSALKQSELKYKFVLLRCMKLLREGWQHIGNIKKETRIQGTSTNSNGLKNLWSLIKTFRAHQSLWMWLKMTLM